MFLEYVVAQCDCSATKLKDAIPSLKHDNGSMANPDALRLHIPEPATRPGEPVSFAGLDIPAAGATRRPAVEDEEASLRDLPFGLIRVLDETGAAVGPWAPTLSLDTLLAGLRAMLLTRLFDDRMFRAHRQGKMSFYIKSTGEEAIAAAQSLMLDAGDMCFPTYRALAWLMARDYPIEALADQIFSNANDPLKGRQLPVLYSARDYGFYSLSGNVGSRFGHAVGWAMASAYKRDDKIAIAYIGDGTTAPVRFGQRIRRSHRGARPRRLYRLRSDGQCRRRSLSGTPRRH